MADEGFQHLPHEEIKVRTQGALNIENANDDKEDSKKIKKSLSIKLSKYDLYVFIIIVSSLVFYKFSLKGCDGTQTYCLVNLSPGFFYILGVYLSLSAIIVDIIIINIVKKKIYPFHLIYTLIAYIYMLYFYDKGSDLSHHGSYNKMIFYFFLFVYGVIILIIMFIADLKRKKYYKLLSSLFLCVILVIIYISYNLRHGCNKWINGLNGMKIENDPERDKCYIIHPDKCWVNMIDGIFDVSRIIREDCSNFRAGERQELIKYLPKRFNRTFNFAYPITNTYTWLNESHFDRFFKNVMRDFIDLDKDDYYNRKLQPEIYLKFNPITQLGNIEMHIQQKEDIIKERREIYNKLPENQRPKYKNFLFIYIDALSRAHFIRKMKHTQQFLNKYLTKEDNSKTVYQMMKYHAFIYFTPPNVNPMFYGESMKNSNGTNIIRAFKQKGYITAQSNNICSRLLYDLEDDYTKDMDFEDYDHENIAMFCDPNFHNYENPFTPYLGPYSIKRRCLYGKDTFDYVLEYGEKFWDTYKDERKFLRVAFQDAHEGTGEVVRYLDERLEMFLNSFLSKGYLEDTAVFIVSDHGNNMIGFYNIFQVQDFVMEKTLASWYIILPNKESKEEIENLSKNQQKMVTPYDIHDTMLYMFKYDKGSKYYSRFGQTIYEEIDASIRDCEKYKLDLQDVWCRCVNYE